MKKIQSQSTSNPNSIAQAAAQVALTGDQSFIPMMTAEFKHRHDFLVTQINQIEGLAFQPADGAFYAFVNVTRALEKLGLRNDLEFGDFLLNSAKLAVVPGSPFGGAGHIRLSYATSMENLERAVERLRSILS